MTQTIDQEQYAEAVQESGSIVINKAILELLLHGATVTDSSVEFSNKPPLIISNAPEHLRSVIKQLATVTLQNTYPIRINSK